MAQLTGGRTVFGQALGIIMLDTRFPRPPGDVGNAATWPFPVQYRIVRGAHPSRIMGDKPDAALEDESSGIPGRRRALERRRRQKPQ